VLCQTGLSKGLKFQVISLKVRKKIFCELGG